MSTIQQTFSSPDSRSREVLSRASDQYGDVDHVVLAVSGGTDSIVAADIVARYGPEYGIEPDAVFHANTGTGVPQSRLTAKLLAEIHDLEYIERGPRRKEDTLAHRILENGWPGEYTGSFATGGHAIEWANRKDKPMDALYSDLDGMQMWISGGRVNESARRSVNIADSAIEVKERRNRRVWVSPIHGWTTNEKVEYLRKHGLPVSEAYLVLGFSGECTACSFDDAGLLDDLDLLSPELAHTIRSLTLWLYMRARRGDVDIPPKKLRWGWTLEDDEKGDGLNETLGDSDRAETMDQLGCSATSCADHNIPEWIRDLPQWQIVDRADVLEVWDGNIDEVAARFEGAKMEVKA